MGTGGVTNMSGKKNMKAEGGREKKIDFGYEKNFEPNQRKHVHVNT